VTIQLDRKYYPNKKIVIERSGNPKGFINGIELDWRKHGRYFISHDELTNAKKLKFILK